MNPTAMPTYVYRCYDADGRLLYVGCSKCPPVRLEGHRLTAWWWPEVAQVRNLVFPDRETALAQERAAIYGERPRCNVKGRWYREDPRPDWTARDYTEFYYAVVQAATVVGVNTCQLIQNVKAEAIERHGSIVTNYLPRNREQVAS